jgi:two-component system sensor histidine kinase ChvG
LFPHFSALTWRIIGFNAIALVVLTGGVILVQTSGRGLVAERLIGIQEAATVVADTLARYATDPDTHRIKPHEAELLLPPLIEPTHLRARVYQPDGSLAVDSRNFLPRGVIDSEELPALDAVTQFKAWLARVYDGIMGVRPFSPLAPYYEGGTDGRVYAEVNTAFAGEPANAERVDEQNRRVLSVAIPLQEKPFPTIDGVLLVSTESRDIDDIVRQERTTLFEVTLVAFAVMLLSSLYLAGTIGEPVRRLAAAADRVRFGHGRRNEIPNFPERTDEIGDLADSLRSMTKGLYDRIDAIESFAADVAHELKNPLTSLSSAIEMMSRARDEKERSSLFAIARGDIKRIDRLITDISDASRLDAELSREAPEPVELSLLLSTIIEIYRMTEKKQDVTLALRDELPMGAIVQARDERLGQVFRNLIDNAISFSPPGGTVTVMASRHEHAARITVEDEGPGIPPDNLESIFERFYTERPVETFGKNSGLGLSIARQIVQSVGGRIWAENRITTDPTKSNGGARLVVDLPLARP